jgi:hypothetical protein
MFEYGEEFYVRRFVYAGERVRIKFRIDSVPGTGRKRWGFLYWYKTSRMYKRERSLYEEHKEIVKVRKSLCDLPDPWDDVRYVDNRRCWKNKKIGKQWMKNL